MKLNMNDEKFCMGCKYFDIPPKCLHPDHARHDIEPTFLCDDYEENSSDE